MTTYQELVKGAAEAYDYFTEDELEEYAEQQKLLIKYRYSLVKYQFYPREKRLEKVVFIKARDSIDADDQIKKQYPEWEVSMFWPVV